MAHFYFPEFLKNPAQIHITRISLKINRRRSHFNYTLKLFLQRSNSVSTGRIYPKSGYTFILSRTKCGASLIDLQARGGMVTGLGDGPSLMWGVRRENVSKAETPLDWRSAAAHRIDSCQFSLRLQKSWEYNEITIFPRNGGKFHGKSSI